MKTLNKNQGIAVAAGMVFLAYLLFSGPIMNLFNPSSQDASAEVPQTGVNVQDVVVGTGPEASSGDTLTVHYIGTLADGKVFDSSVDRNVPFVFTIGTGSVIRGWDEGLIGMKVGGKRELIIAPDYGYGPQGVGPIPPNSTLYFQVELLDAKKPASL
ncbi:MAG: FKBP-type peptidyl-prolyl cis-trans isomerase [Minisyncoccia bacterium]